MKLAPKKNEELIKLRKEVTKTLSEALKNESKAKHEKSHLLESYGALILALEEEFKKFRYLVQHCRNQSLSIRCCKFLDALSSITLILCWLTPIESSELTSAPSQLELP